MGDFLGAKFLVAFTQSGDTVKRLSRYRSPPIPLLAFTPPDPATRSQLNLTWGRRNVFGPARGLHGRDGRPGGRGTPEDRPLSEG